MRGRGTTRKPGKFSALSQQPPLHMDSWHFLNVSKFLCKIYHWDLFQMGLPCQSTPPPSHLDSGYVHMCENREKDNNQNDDIRTKEKEYFWISGLELQIRLGPEIFKFEIMTKIGHRSSFIQC